MPDITYDVGRVSFVMKGAWNLATAYEKLDAVSYGGSLYIAKQDVPGGTAITNTTYWQLAAEKGDKGDTGGVDSVNGQQGDVWFPDSRQLISDGYTTDTEPFLMKGNDSDSDRFELAKKLGNTVGVNQLAKELNSTNWAVANTNNSIQFSGNTATVTATAQVYDGIKTNYSMSLINGHKYLVSIQAKSSNGLQYKFSADASSVNANTVKDWTTLSSSAYTTLCGIITYVYNVSYIAGMRMSNRTADAVQGEALTVTAPLLIDLTLWFGSNDRIPSDLLSHPENWGRYYAGSLDYAAGYLDSADGTVLRSIGRNIWNENWQYSNTLFGAWCIESVDIIPVSPNSEIYGYCSRVNFASRGLWFAFYDAEGNLLRKERIYGTTFTMPSDAHGIRIGILTTYYGETVYKYDTTLSLYYPGESGYDQYYPYQVLAEVDTGDEALRSAGAVADEKTPDGTITRRVGVVDLGTLTWLAVTYAGVTMMQGVLTTAPHDASSINVQCSKYEASNDIWSSLTLRDKLISNNYAGNTVYAYDSAYTDAATFKTAMSGVYLYYELATPTTEQGTAYNPLIATVKGGVLSWTNTKGIPVGHESHYFENLRKRVEDRLPDPPSADGTYRLTCTISGGVKTYSWEA